MYLNHPPALAALNRELIAKAQADMKRRTENPPPPVDMTMEKIGPNLTVYFKCPVCQHEQTFNAVPPNYFECPQCRTELFAAKVSMCRPAPPPRLTELE